MLVVPAGFTIGLMAGVLAGLFSRPLLGLVVLSAGGAGFLLYVAL